MQQKMVCVYMHADTALAAPVPVSDTEAVSRAHILPACQTHIFLTGILHCHQ